MNDMNDIILSTQNGEPVASSRDVAKRFGKEHNHVLRDIKALEEGVSKNGQAPMFFKSEYTHPQNHQKYPMYLMNRDGFSLPGFDEIMETALATALPDKKE